MKSLVALCVLDHAALTGSRVAVSLSALALGATTLQAGLLLALYALVPTLASQGLGRWIDRIGPCVPALAGTAAICAGLALPAWRTSPATLWLAAALVGAGYAATVLALQHQLGRLERRDGARGGFSTFALGTAISGCLGPALAGQCLGRWGARPTFALLDALALTALLAMASMRGALGGGGASAARMTPRGGSAWRRLGEPGLRRILLADLLMAIAWNANSVVVPIYGARHGGSPAAIGNLLATFGAAVLIARVLPSAWARHVDDWRAIRRALACGGACFLALPLTRLVESPGLPFALEAFLGLGLGSALASVLALLHRHAPAGHDGEVLGLRLVVLNMSAVGLPIMLGGLGNGVALMVFTTLLGGALALSAITITLPD